MKRLLAIALVAFVATAGFAQTTGLESVQSDSSFGVFGNELDAALTVQEAGNRPGFSELTNRMIFGGLSNLNFTDAGGIEADGTFNASGSNPLWLGYYSPGDIPFSLFAGMFYTGATGNAADGTIVTTTTDPGITVGTTTTSHKWTSRTIATTYTANRMFDWYEKHAQVITSLGGMNVGLGVDLWLQNSSTQANNYEETETNYYDTAAVGEVPDPAVDYTFTDTQTDLAKTTRVGITAPVFLRTGDLGHTVSIGGTFEGNDFSYSRTQSYSNPEDGGLAATVTEANDGTVTSNEISIDGGYELTMPGLLGENENNEFSAGATVTTTFYGAEYATTLITQDKTWAGGGAAAVLGDRNFDEITRTLDGQMDLEFDLMASHSFFFDLGESIRFGLVPDTITGVELDKEDNLYTSEVSVDRQDNDNDGEFTSVGDRIVTATTTYSGTAAGVSAAGFTSSNATDNIVVTTEFGLAGSMEFTPGNWPFSITIGSRPRVRLVSTKATTTTSESSTTTVTVDGNGDTVSTVVTQANAADETSSWSHTTTVDAEHRIGLNMLLGEAVRLDVALNLSSSASILDFRDMVIQAIVKLP